MPTDNKMIHEATLDAFAAFRRKLGQPHQDMRMIGNSMQPCIRHGDKLHVELHPTLIRCGDVLIWRYKGKFIAHRLVAKCGEKLFLRGDANIVYDPPILKNLIVGRVIGVENAAGFADYNSLRWRTVNLLMIKFSGGYRTLGRIKGGATRLIKKTLNS